MNSCVLASSYNSSIFGLVCRNSYSSIFCFKYQNNKYVNIQLLLNHVENQFWCACECKQWKEQDTIKSNNSETKMISNEIGYSIADILVGEFLYFRSFGFCRFQIFSKYLLKFMISNFVEFVFDVIFEFFIFFFFVMF